MKLIQWLTKLNSHSEESLRNTAATLDSAWSAIMSRRSSQPCNLDARDSNLSTSRWKMLRSALKKSAWRRSCVMSKVASKRFLDSVMVTWEESWICCNHCPCNLKALMQHISLNSKCTNSLEMLHRKILKTYWRFYLPRISTVRLQNWEAIKWRRGFHCKSCWRRSTCSWWIHPSQALPWNF